MTISREAVEAAEYVIGFPEDVWHSQTVLMARELLRLAAQSKPDDSERITAEWFGGPRRAGSIEVEFADGGVVLDPFCGSGTTLAVAHRLGRNSIGMDIRKSQVALTKRRMKKVGAT